MSVRSRPPTAQVGAIPPWTPYGGQGAHKNEERAHHTSRFVHQEARAAHAAGARALDYTHSAGARALDYTHSAGARAHSAGARAHSAGTRAFGQVHSTATSMGRKVWDGLTALSSKVTAAAAGVGHAAKGHVHEFTRHVAAAHHEVLQALINRQGHVRNHNAQIDGRHYTPHKAMHREITSHIEQVAGANGLLHAGASANFVVRAADLSAQGYNVDEILNETVRHKPHDHAPTAAQTALVRAVHTYITGESGAHMHHRATAVQASAATAVLVATVAGADHADADHH